MAEEVNALDKALRARGLPAEIIGKQLIFSGHFAPKTADHLNIEVRARCSSAIFGDDQFVLYGENCQFVWDIRGCVWKFVSHPFGYAEIRAWGRITVVD
ncbi:MAG: hypothetical protein AAB575_03450 [Patescibacteria group bacterium]